MQNVKLIHGDCLEGMKKINDKSIDMILTDPPYGINFQSHSRKNIYDKIHNDDNTEFLESYFKECNRILKDNTAIYCFCSWHNVDKFKIQFEKYFKLKNIIICVKNNHRSGDLKASYSPKYEMILYGNKGRKCFSGKREEDVVNSNKTKNEFHPTQKPIDLLERFIRNSSNEYDGVFDGYMGSGSTGVACVNANRCFIGIELEEKYSDIAQKRIESEV
jgi:site-specific DNA-methyltransferase (adenine-specific)